MTYAKPYLLSVALMALGGIATPAAAQPPVYVTGPDIVVRHVSFTDLNLASDPGVRALNHRVRGAVNDVCTEATGGNDGSTEWRYNMVSCSQASWTDARAQIDLAVERAKQLASTGSSAIAAAAITIRVPAN